MQSRKLVRLCILGLGAGLFSCGGSKTSGGSDVNFDKLTFTTLTTAQTTSVQTVNTDVGDLFSAITDFTPAVQLQSDLGLFDATSESAVSQALAPCARGFVEISEATGTKMKRVAGSYPLLFELRNDACPATFKASGTLVTAGSNGTNTYTVNDAAFNFAAKTDAFKNISAVQSLTAAGTASGKVVLNTSSEGTALVTGTFVHKTLGTADFRVKGSYSVTKVNSVPTGQATSELIIKFADFNLKAEVTGTDVTGDNTDEMVYKINDQTVTRAVFQSYLGSYNAKISPTFPFFDGNGDSYLHFRLGASLTMNHN